MGTLGYVISPDIKRCSLSTEMRAITDDHLGKYNGLGGKMEPNEDIAACMKREIFEEANIECLDLKLRGTINWTGFGRKERIGSVLFFVLTGIAAFRYPLTPKVTWSGSISTRCTSCLFGKGTAIFYIWCSMTIRALFTALCLITTINLSAGPSQGSEPMRITLIPALSDNYIYLLSQNDWAVVIDPAEAKPVLAALDEKKLHLRAILNTHHHGDHTGGNLEIKKQKSA